MHESNKFWWSRETREQPVCERLVVSGNRPVCRYTSDAIANEVGRCKKGIGLHRAHSCGALCFVVITIGGLHVVHPHW